MANPLGPQDGRSRVRRNLEEQEAAASRDVAPTPAPAPAPGSSTLSKGVRPTDAEKAKSQKGLIDMMRKRGDIAANDDDDEDDKTA